MTGNNPFDFATLADYFEGRLDAERRAAVQAWIDSAPDSADLRWLQAFYAVNAQVTFAPLSDAARRSLLDRFAARRKAAAGPTVWQRLVAALTFDSDLPQFAPAMRSAHGASRQLLFSTAQADVALDVARAGERFTVNGQLLFNDADAAPCSVQLLAGDSAVALTGTDTLGEFVLADLPAGSYQLVVSHDAFDILIETLALN